MGETATPDEIRNAVDSVLNDKKYATCLSHTKKIIADYATQPVNTH